MIAALMLQLPTFVNETEEESIEIEIEAGIDVPNYLLVPEYADLTAEADQDVPENNSSSEDHFLFDLDLDSLLNDNSWKYNETGYDVTASYHARCLPHHVQLAIKDGLLVLEVSYSNFSLILSLIKVFFNLESCQGLIESSREDCWWYKEECGGHEDVNGLRWFQNSNVKPNPLEFTVWDDKRNIGSHRKGSQLAIET